MDENPSKHNSDSSDAAANAGANSTPGDGESASFDPAAAPYARRPATRRRRIELPPQYLPARRDLDQLRRATASMVEGGLPLEDAAQQFGVDPDTLHTWQRTYVNFVGKEGRAVAAKRERIAIDEAATEKFNTNWGEMMRLTEVEQPYISPLRRKLMRSPFTRWMFNGDVVDKITVTGAAAVLALTLLAVKVAFSHRGSNREEPDSTAGQSIPFGPDTTELDDEQKNELLKRTADALKQFAEFETWRERFPYVRNQERVGRLMEAYYQKNPDGPLTELAINPDASFIKRRDGQFVFIQGTLARAGTAKRNIAFLIEVTGGDPEFLFDWEVLVNYEPVPWEEFTASKSTTPSPFRVRVLAGNYYNEPFMDNNKFASFEIQLLHHKEKVYAFVARNSKVAAQIATSLKKQLSGSRAMILNLRYPADAKLDNILEIDSFVADGWLGGSKK